MRTTQLCARRHGFTLVEIMIVVVIIGVIAGLAIGPISDALRRGRIASVVGTVATVQKAVASYHARYGGRALPLTEGWQAFSFLAPGSTGDSTNVPAAASLDSVFQACGLLTGPVSVKMGKNATSTAGVALIYNAATHLFESAAGSSVAPSINLANTARVECQLAQSFTPRPDLAAGANFRLDGVTNMRPNSRIVSLVIPNASIADARQLSLAMDGAAFSSTDTTSEDANGRVVYPAPSGDLTTVYVYVVHQ